MIRAPRVSTGEINRFARRLEAAKASGDDAKVEQLRKDAPRLELGTRGSAVRDVEKQLKKEGLLKGPVDDFFDAKTKAAVHAFERSQDWNADGVVGLRVWRSLVDIEKTPGTGGQPDPQPTGKSTPFKLISSNLKRGLPWDVTAKTLDRLLATKPDAIGLQEFYDGDLGRLKAHMAKRGYGVNLETDVPIAYNKKKFELVADGSRQFTPRTDWNPPRFGNFVALRNKQTGELSVVTNTHLTQQIRIPRNKRFHEEQVRELGDMLRDLKKRFGADANLYLTGDMNTARLKYLKPLMQGTGLKPVRVPGASHIDWIFSETKADSKRGIETPSDHDSILAVFKR